MNYLVTGGSGFIGSHLVEKLLENGHSVINVDNFDDFYDHKIKIKNTLESLKLATDFPFENKEKDLQHLQAITKSERYQLQLCDLRHLDDLRQVFASQKIDMVVHLAALAGVRPSIERPLDYLDVNVKGSMHLWELCREFGLKKFVCASSSSVYGNQEQVPFAEDDVVDFPISPYAATKKCGEVLSHVYHHLYGLDIIQLRFFTVYGPRQRPDLAIHKFTQLINNQQEIPFFGDGSTARDYTYIDDILDGILKSIQHLEENEKVYEIINLGESEVVKLGEMIACIEQSLDQKAQIKKLPMQPGDVQKTNAKIDKAQNLIGYQPKIKFQNGINRFVEWFLNKK